MIDKEAEKIKEKVTLNAEIPEVKKISMWLDDYNDMFSDFDPRPYSERALSDDFLNASHKMFRETKTGKFELRLLVPKSMRDEKQESLIKRRLKSFFKHRENEGKEKIDNATKKGVSLAFFGFIMMVLATYLYYIENDGFFLKFLIVILEPAGWFSVWYGLDQIFYTAEEKKSSYNFFKKISEADIIFDEY